MSGLSRTPGKRVQDNILTGVRIPLPPPESLNTIPDQSGARLAFPKHLRRVPALPGAALRVPAFTADRAPHA